MNCVVNRLCLLLLAVGTTACGFKGPPAPIYPTPPDVIDAQVKARSKNTQPAKEHLP